MATALQRTRAIADALLNRPATDAQITRMVEANLGLHPVEVAELTQQQKLQRFLERQRLQMIQAVHAYERPAAVNEADVAVLANVTTDFTETP